ncbi:MAG: thermonuclease family protein [Parvibaculum sp.]|jgi:endonuclease YncB( thermonuclease family)
MLDLFLAGITAAAVVGYTVGPASVIDGDTLIVNETRARLVGIDAPEVDHTCREKGRSAVSPCGDLATAGLQDLVGNGPVRCQGSKRDRYRRLLATCLDHHGRDVGQFTVRTGCAVAPARWDRPNRSDEATARAQGLGRWAADFEDPASYRRRRFEAQK